MRRNFQQSVSAIHGKQGLLKEAKQVAALGMQSLRISLTMENAEETEKILDEFLGVYYHNRIPAERNFTKGHFKRGAE